MNELIKISSLTVKYGNHLAIVNSDLDIYENDFLGIIGPNGGGKTTLVKAILGALPYSGQILYSEKLRKNNRRKAIGYLPQINDFDTKFPISVREVVLSGLQIEKGFFGNYTKDDKALADELLDSVGISEIRKKPIGEISGGQLQRTLLCRSLISEPQLLILDEPANFVDNRFERELYDLLKSLNDHMTIIMVSHDLGTITSVVKNIVCVNKHIHRHDSNKITAEQLENYDCPIQLVTHGEIPHTVLHKH